LEQQSVHITQTCADFLYLAVQRIIVPNRSRLIKRGLQPEVTGIAAAGTLSQALQDVLFFDSAPAKHAVAARGEPCITCPKLAI
jgi:hypothetical protein